MQRCEICSRIVATDLSQCEWKSSLAWHSSVIGISGKPLSCSWFSVFLSVNSRITLLAVCVLLRQSIRRKDFKKKTKKDPEQQQWISLSLSLSSLPLYQCVLLHIPGTRVPRAGAQSGDDKRWGAHGPWAQPVLHLPAALLRAALPLPLPGLELPQVRLTASTGCKGMSCQCHGEKVLYT